MVIVYHEEAVEHAVLLVSPFADAVVLLLGVDPLMRLEPRTLEDEGWQLTFLVRQVRMSLLGPLGISLGQGRLLGGQIVNQRDFLAEILVLHHVHGLPGVYPLRRRPILILNTNHNISNRLILLMTSIRSSLRKF